MKKNQSLSEVTQNYLNKKKEEQLALLLTCAKKHVRRWLAKQIWYIQNESSENFITNVALEYIVRVMEDRISILPEKAIINLAYQMHYKPQQLRSKEGLSSRKAVYSRVTSRLSLKDKLNKALKSFPTHMKYSLLYAVAFPNQAHLKKIYKKYYTETEYNLLMLKVNKLQDSLIQVDLGLKLPNTQAARLLVLSALHRVSPALLVLLLLLGDINKFIQFCTLFQGQKIIMPSMKKLIQEIEETTKLAAKLEKGKLTAQESKMLALLATETKSIKNLDFDITLNPLLSEYLGQAAEIVLDNYKGLQKKVISQLEVTDPRNLSRAYKFFDSEINAQFGLIKNILQSVEAMEKLQNLPKRRKK